MKIILLFFPSRSYTSRIYASEDNARYRPMKEKNIWARYALSVYRQTRIIGSGPDEIAGNKKAELKLQLR